MNKKQRLAIVTALKIERPGCFTLSLQRGNVYTFDHSIIRVEVCGFGIERASRGTEQLCKEFKPDLIVLCGFCGSVYPDARIGDLLIAQQVYYQDKCEMVNRDEIMKIREILTDVSVSCKIGDLQTVDDFAFSQENIKPGMCGVDMEAYAVIKKAKEFKVNVCVVKSVSDIIPRRQHFPFPRVRQLLKIGINFITAKRQLNKFYRSYFERSIV